MEITLEEYREYQDLKRNVTLRLNHESARSLSLEDDIDTPLKKCVMALALLGCKPMWSCCGYDYPDQPMHKSHLYYGVSWVVLSDNEYTRQLEWILRDCPPPYQDRYGNRWNIYPWGHPHYGKYKYGLMSDWTRNNSWPDPRSIHFYEPGALAISILENWLMGLSDLFVGEVEICDTNAMMKNEFPHWQYPTKENWLVRKSDLRLHPHS